MCIICLGCNMRIPSCRCGEVMVNRGVRVDCLAIECLRKCSMNDEITVCIGEK